MKDRPILFSAPMVRAIIEGRKTQTRRVVKPQPDAKYDDGTWYPDLYNGGPQWNFWGKGDHNRNICGTEIGTRGLCPYGAPGDRLWVKETWAEGGRSFQLPCGEYEWSSHLKARYLATDDAIKHQDCSCHWRVRPSIHMPRWASRITLEVVSVRVERLQAISDADAIAEGCGGPGYGTLAVLEYSRLWDEINGKGAWADNPWVWVVEFKKIDGGAA